MSRKTIFALASVLALIGLIIILAAKRPMQRARQENVEATLNKSNGLTISAPDVNAKIPVAQEHGGVREVLRRESIWKALFSTPIVFYGRVVDEKDRPVGGATVEASFVDTAGGENTHVTSQAGEDGRFFLSGRGLGITIAVSKKGYYRLRESEGIFAYNEAAGQVAKHSDPANSATFRLRKMGSIEKLIVQGISGRLLENYDAIGLSFETGKRTLPSQSDLIIEIWTDQKTRGSNRGGKFAWRCRISVPNGGIMAREGQFDFVAPENGYSPSDEIEMTVIDSPTWRSQIAKDYFVKVNGGKFARIVLTIAAGGDRFFTLNSYLNPTGSRNLEYVTEE